MALYKCMGACLVYLMLLNCASAIQVTPEVRVDEPHFEQLLLQMHGQDSHLHKNVEALLAKARRDLEFSNRTCTKRQILDGQKVAQSGLDLQSLKDKVKRTEKDVEAERDKINADMGLIKSIRLMLKSQQLKRHTRRLLEETQGQEFTADENTDPTAFLMGLLQTKPSTPESSRKIHAMLDKMEANLRKQLDDHAAKKNLIALQHQVEQATVEHTKLQHESSEYVLSCTRKLKSLRTFKGLAEELLKLESCKSKAVSTEVRSQAAHKSVGALFGKRAEKEIEAAEALAAKAVAQCRKQAKLAVKTAKTSLATCQRQKHAQGEQQSFRAFKSYVYGKLQELVKTSTLAVERERKVVSTVRTENSELRMRLEAAYESSKRGMMLRDLTTKIQWCQQQLARALHQNSTARSPSVSN